MNVWGSVKKAFAPPGAHDLSLADWQQSLFWAFAGILALGACISSTNQRINAEVLIFLDSHGCRLALCCMCMQQTA